MGYLRFIEQMTNMYVACFGESVVANDLPKAVLA